MSGVDSALLSLSYEEVAALSGGAPMAASFSEGSLTLGGDVKGRRVLMFDDMISTAGTVSEAARVVMEEGAVGCECACTHAVMVGQAFNRLAVPEISRITITDTIPGGDRLKPLEDKLTIRSVARLLGEAVHRIHHDQSVSAMFREGIGVKR